MIDTRAMTAADASAVLPHLPDVHLVLLSSIDVYRAYEPLLAGQGGEPVPLTESSAVRSGRYPLRDLLPGLGEHYDSSTWSRCTCRAVDTAPAVDDYGEHDGSGGRYSCCQGSGRARQIPFGAGPAETRRYVGDVATAVLAALDRPGAAAGEVFNVGDLTTGTARDHALAIVAAACSEASLVTVPEDLVPPDTEDTRSNRPALPGGSPQGGDRARLAPRDLAETIRCRCRWHLENPPAEVDEDFSADDRALAAAES